MYQGWGITRRYFEGWYFKVVNASESRAFAFIPGIAMDESGNSHAFIQVLDGKEKRSEYFSFDAGLFIPSDKRFDVSIGNNRFSSGSMKLDLPDICRKPFFFRYCGMAKQVVLTRHHGTLYIRPLHGVQPRHSKHGPRHHGFPVNQGRRDRLHRRAGDILKKTGVTHSLPHISGCSQTISARPESPSKPLWPESHG